MKRILFCLHEASLTGAPICAYKVIKYLQQSPEGYDILVHTAKDGILIDRMRHDKISTSLILKNLEHGLWISRIKQLFIYYFKFIIMLITFKPNIFFSNTICNCGQVILGKLLGAKTIVWVHEGRNVLLNCKYRLKFSSYFTNKYIAVSHYVGKELFKTVNQPSVVIYNGIENIQIDDHYRKANDIPVSGIVGVVDNNKGQLVAVKALEHLINQEKLNIILQIIGPVANQNYYDEIKMYVKSHGLENYVVFTGPIERIEKIYTPLDFVIVASTDETFSLVTLEAMALGRLVIASNTGGIPELVEDGVTGLLFTPGNHIELSEKIKYFLLHHELQGQIVSMAKLKVRSEFMIDKMLSNIASQIDSV